MYTLRPQACECSGSCKCSAQSEVCKCPSTTAGSPKASNPTKSPTSPSKASSPKKAPASPSKAESPTRTSSPGKKAAGHYVWVRKAVQLYLGWVQGV
ncbi:hypothetical protein BASA81_013191 [Batrachochytrium salamandrivorans]|nr:hypothetical protein BASA81_013191 [Batrachochytrium salamandrivorans]